MSASGHVLTIVIPALNEEEAIGSTLRRCLDARATIESESNVKAVEIIVVSDGSSDRTEEIARSFEDVNVLVFERNRGYGAAIQTGFAYGTGDLVAFLDADGTCDPLLFAPMCRAIDEQRADVVLGSRMGKDSEMPLVRTIGNTIFAWMLGLLSRRRVRDTASGMRVLRRSALEHLTPLPDGLHFTPAMSARILMEDRLRLVELPMPYAERVGRSKLSVLRDGVRFLTCIVQAAVAHRPARPLLLAGALSLFAAVVVGWLPLHYYVANRRLEEWMIYRLLLASLLSTLTAMIVTAAVVAERMAALAHGREPRSAGPTGLVSRLLQNRGWWIALALTAVACVVVASGAVEYLGTGHVTMHWSRAALASLLVVVAVATAVSEFLLDMLGLIERQRAGSKALRPPDRIHPVRRPASGVALAEGERAS
jgi:glycosyltransferase involved in cell wall biosynthesis